MIRSAISRFKKTISSLTEITKLQKDNQSLFSTVNITDVVHEVILDLDMIIRKTGAQVKTSLSPGTPASFSEKNLRSIVYNLISNALKYKHPERHPEIHISCQPQERFFLFMVRDNGLGISSEQQAKLFTMFKRFHDHVEGSGVGLYMVKRIVENVGGKIEVESEEGIGSLFKVYIPTT